MTPSARLAAAIQVLSEIEERHQPAHLALKSWGGQARYAGSKDRAWVSGLVLDALRRKRSLGWLVGDDGPRARALAALRFAWGWDVQEVIDAAAGEPHGPGSLTRDEVGRLTEPRSLADAPPPVLGDYPDWLDASLERAFGQDRAEEGASLSHRAPVDLRVNTLKADAERVLKALAGMRAEPSDALSNALRIPAPGAAERAAAVESLPVFAKGWFEVQDLGSQIAAAAAGEVKGRQVLDYCSGGGGKTLALAAAMANTGQIYAYDTDMRRLSEVVTRGQRAGVRNLQIRSPSDQDPLAGLEGRMDVVFVDAPCTGSGTWRRHPDAKWRLTPAQLERRTQEQAQVLGAAQAFVRPGGRLVYVTCSILAEENEDQVSAFLQGNPGFMPVSTLDAIAASDLATEPGLAALSERLTSEGFLRLSPRAGGADGFFIAVMERRS